MVGQVAALKLRAHAFLTAISTSPVRIGNVDLPTSGEAWMEHMSVEAEWSDRADAVTVLVEDARLTAGTAQSRSTKPGPALLERDFDRSGGYLAPPTTASYLGRREWRGRLNQMKVPFSFFTAQPTRSIPSRHGEALARAVANANFVKIEGWRP